MTATAAMVHSASASAMRSARRPFGQEFYMDQDFCGAYPSVAGATSEYSFVRLFDGRTGRWRRATGRNIVHDKRNSLFRGCGKKFRHMLPMDEVVDPGLEVIRPPVAVVDVVGVLPHVATED